jgi:MoaA/NifB/PqqE/SkfB family radical SAM enzyme
MNSRLERPVAISPRGFVPPDNAGRNYVMKGFASNRQLDTYHLILAPTHACNLRCKHCYLPDHANQLLPKKIALRILDEWSEIVLDERKPFQGIFHVKGGEPFVVPYLEDVMHRLIEVQSLRLMLTTNGTFTSAATLSSLKTCAIALNGNVTVIVSLDGATSTTHDSLRGNGQFKITLSFLEALQEMRVTTHLNCVLHTGNLIEVPAYVQLAKRLEVGQINFLPLVPKGYGTALRASQAPHLSLHNELQAVYDSGNEATKKLLSGSLSHILDRETSEGIPAAHECVAAYRGLFYITPEGTVFTCPNLLGSDHSIGNVYNDSLRTLCTRLPNLYENLRGANSPSDKHVCTGERVLYEKIKDSANLESLRLLQKQLDDGSPSSVSSSTTAYCVSRNF